MARTEFSADSLLEGAIRALAHGGRLLTDARALYNRGSFGSSLGFAVFATEELGRSAILLRLRDEAQQSGPVSLEEVRAQCEDHLVKLRSGRSATTARLSRSQTARFTSALTSDDTAVQDAYVSSLEKAHKRQRKGGPDDLQAARLRAFYVDPTDSGAWQDPADVTPEAALRVLQEAEADYATRWHRATMQGLVVAAQASAPALSSPKPPFVGG